MRVFWVFFFIFVMHQIETLEFPLQTSQFVESYQRTDGKFLSIQSVFRRQVQSLMSDPVDFCRSQRSQWCAQVRHLQATITCRQQDRGSRRTGFGGGQTGVRCLYFPCGGLWLLWSLCHTTISNSSNSNAEGGEWETESSYFGIRVRKKDRLAGREKETESNGRGKSLCASFVLKKKAFLRGSSSVASGPPLGSAVDPRSDGGGERQPGVARAKETGTASR